MIRTRSMRVSFTNLGGDAVKIKDAALRIGQAATQLEISPHHLRQLCKCGLVEAELSTAANGAYL